MKYIKSIKEMLDPMGSWDPKQLNKKFKLYRHPCSTSTLFYLIPSEFDSILRNDDSFKIGFYGTNFKEYIETKYGSDKGYLSNKSYIEYIGEFEAEISNVNKEDYYTYKDMYYYEFDIEEINKLIPFWNK